MRKLIPYFLLLFLISFSAFLYFFFNNPATFKEVVIPNKFKIVIPEYLSATNDSASVIILRYENAEKNAFLIIYEEEDTTLRTTDSVFKKFSSTFLSNIQQAHMIKYYPDTINARPALIGNIRGKVNDFRVYYRIAVIQSKGKYYELIFGTSNDNQPYIDEDMNTCIRSLTSL